MVNAVVPAESSSSKSTQQFTPALELFATSNSIAIDFLESGVI